LRDHAVLVCVLAWSADFQSADVAGLLGGFVAGLLGLFLIVALEEPGDRCIARKPLELGDH
jgi:hypothetical protein